jgi:hypothetical protein
MTYLLLDPPPTGVAVTAARVDRTRCYAEEAIDPPALVNG